jgi:hypothetical protein
MRRSESRPSMRSALPRPRRPRAPFAALGMMLPAACAFAAWPAPPASVFIDVVDLSSLQRRSIAGPPAVDAGDAERAAPGLHWRLRAGAADERFGAGLPAANAALRAADFRPLFSAGAAWTLPRDWTLTLAPSLARERDADGRRRPAHLLAATVAREWTPRLRTVFELAACAGGGGPRAEADAGISFTAGSLQIAAMLSRGAGAGTPAPRSALRLSAGF